MILLLVAAGNDARREREFCCLGAGDGSPCIGFTLLGQLSLVEARLEGRAVCLCDLGSWFRLSGGEAIKVSDECKLRVTVHRLTR